MCVCVSRCMCVPRVFCVSGWVRGGGGGQMGGIYGRLQTERWEFLQAGGRTDGWHLRLSADSAVGVCAGWWEDIWIWRLRLSVDFGSTRNSVIITAWTGKIDSAILSVKRNHSFLSQPQLPAENGKVINALVYFVEERSATCFRECP